MSVSLLEVLEHSGYDPLNNPEDATWLLSKQNEFNDLITQIKEVQEDLDGEDPSDYQPGPEDIPGVDY